jgi:hypothetical protein
MEIVAIIENNAAKGISQHWLLGNLSPCEARVFGRRYNLEICKIAYKF